MHPDCTETQWQSKPCQEWNHREDSHLQYALVHWRGHNQYVHRLSWALSHGHMVEDLTSNDFVCHHCDNPRCFEPLHLFLSTNQGNVADMHAKGFVYRGGAKNPVRGSNHPMAVLTEDNVREIRDIYARDPLVTQRELAERFGVTQTLVGMIVRRKIWTHI